MIPPGRVHFDSVLGSAALPRGLPEQQLGPARNKNNIRMHPPRRRIFHSIDTRDTNW